MKKYQVVTLTLTLIALVSFSFAQETIAKEAAHPTSTGSQAATSVREAMNGDRLAILLSAVGVSVGEPTLPVRSQTFQEMQIRWDAPVQTPPQGAALMNQEPLGRTLTVTKRIKRNRALPRQRSFELSTNHILLVAVNGQQQLRWWSLILDPRTIRAEFPDAEGRLSGQVLYRPKAEFIAAFPDDQTITELRLYQPHWTGSEFTLEPLGAVPLQ